MISRTLVYGDPNPRRIVGMRRPLGPIWHVEWSDSGMSGKTVVLIDRATGRRGYGHHWSDWDQAVRMAIENAGVMVLSDTSSSDRPFYTP